MEKKHVLQEKKSEIEEEEEEEEVVLPGFRFHPTDEELVGFYLRRKVGNKRMSIDIIKEIDIYKYDPWDLPKFTSGGDADKEWYFFCLRGRKYRNSIRPNRVTGSGFWKATGIDRPIYSGSDAGECIGLKKSLVYYRGSAGKGTKTDWMMHEFRLPSNNKDAEACSPNMQEAEIWTICRIFKRNVSTIRKYAVSNAKQTRNRTDSGSKSTSSLESDAGDECKYFGWNNVGFIENQLFAMQAQQQQAAATAMTLQQQQQQLSAGGDDGNWDELGRIMECYMKDPWSRV